MNVLVQTRNLTKYYRGMAALRDCNLTVDRGEVFGLLGPNGAGKTTLLRLLLGFLRPSRGDAQIAGCDCYRESLAVRRRVSYLPGDVRLFSRMRAGDAVAFLAGLRGAVPQSRIDELAQVLELDLSRRVSAMSTGTRQKVALVAAFAADATVLILDEPTSNLDPSMRSAVARLVAQARGEGRTVIFSSHVLSEVEEVCDRVAILRSGQVVHLQSLLELRRRHRIRVRFQQPCACPAEIAEQVDWTETADGQVILETGMPLAPLLKWLADEPVEDVAIEPAGLRSLYDRFHGDRLTGRGGS